MEDRKIEERHDAGQAVDVNLRICPMIYWLPADKGWFLGPAECRLDLIAIPIGSDDLLRASVHMVRKDDVFKHSNFLFGLVANS